MSSRPFPPVSCLAALLAALLAGGVSPGAPSQAQEAVFPPPPILHRPTLALGFGKLSYRETDFETAPGLKSSYREMMMEIDFGWEFVFIGHHGLNIDFRFGQTSEGTERWKEFDIPVQENDLDVGRFEFSVGYMASTWNRAVPPRALVGAARAVRFAGGANLYYRRQAFLRNDFVDFTTDPPVFIDAEVEEVFDMVGAEGAVDLEFGPRHIAAGFLRGRFGGGYVGVTNDGLEPTVDEEDAQIDTSWIQGTVEVGVVSQFTPQVELRLGYRWQHMLVFQEQETVSGFDPVLGPVDVTIELPDNTTEIHLFFIQAVFPF